MNFIHADKTGSRYAGRVIEAPHLSPSGLVFLSFLDGPADAFPGAIADPIPVRVSGARLTIERA